MLEMGAYGVGESAEVTIIKFLGNGPFVVLGGLTMRLHECGCSLPPWGVLKTWIERRPRSKSPSPSGASSSS